MTSAKNGGVQTPLLVSQGQKLAYPPPPLSEKNPKPAYPPSPPRQKSNFDVLI